MRIAQKNADFRKAGLWHAKEPSAGTGANIWFKPSTLIAVGAGIACLAAASGILIAAITSGRPAPEGAGSPFGALTSLDSNKTPNLPLTREHLGRLAHGENAVSGDAAKISFRAKSFSGNLLLTDPNPLRNQSPPAPGEPAAASDLDSIQERSRGQVQSVSSTAGAESSPQAPVSRLPPAAPALSPATLGREASSDPSSQSSQQFTAEEQAEMLTRAAAMIRKGDIAGARVLLSRLSRSGNGPATLALAQSYDPAVLLQWNVRGIKPDPQKALELYQKALENGVGDAQAFITALAAVQR